MFFFHLNNPYQNDAYYLLYIYFFEKFIKVLHIDICCYIIFGPLLLDKQMKIKQFQMKYLKVNFLLIVLYATE